MPVTTDYREEMLLVCISSPPVNAISHEERSGLRDAMTLAKATWVRGVIIYGADARFAAGADIREFGLEPTPPHLPDVLDAIEACAKPVIAAIAGQALGGGLELALACHYRVAATTAKFGLPEVTLGLIPGAGGTQRLPRLIGPVAAARMISTGQAIGASEAFTEGLIDMIADDGDVVAAAIALAVSVGARVDNGRRLSTRPLEGGADVPEALDALARFTAKRVRGAEAPLAAIALAQASLTLSYADAVQRDRETFLALRSSAQARALRHIFFAERSAARLDGDDAKAVARDVQSIGIVGAGTMGRGIAMSFADAGLCSTIVEASCAALDGGMRRIGESYRTSAKRGRITPEEADRRIESITGSTDYDALARCDIIIEAAFETMEVKSAIFRQLDTIAKPGAILASNTSYLDLDQIAAHTRRPQDVVGMHYFSPANVMRLLEVVKGADTGPDVLATCIAVGRRTGKVPVVAGVCNGFIGNRMLRAYNREAGLLLLEGAASEQIDAALVDFGMAMGPFAVADLSGIDIGYKARQSMPDGSYEPLAMMVHDSLVEAGHFGRKTGAGFYRYDDKATQLGANLMVQEIAEHARQSAGIEPRDVSNGEILDRCLYALINEGGHILAEGIAARASDLDVVFVNGYGFPRYLGGPMFHADIIGLERIKHSVLHMRAGRFGQWWEPSPFLDGIAVGS